MYKMALMTWRISRLRGRPPILAAGIKSLIQSQRRSARSVGYVCVFIPQVYPTKSADRHPFQTVSHNIRGQSVQETAFPPSPYPNDPDLALRAPMPVACPDPPP